MGFFKEMWTGIPDKPKTQSTNEQTTNAVKNKISTPETLPKKKIEGEILQSDFTPESQEQPRTVECQQVIYGKVLEKPRGGLLDGSDHSVTGHSEEFASGVSVAPQDHFAHQLGNLQIGANNFQFREYYPWKEDGGELIKRIVRVNDKEYVVVVKRMLRPEDGENNDGKIKRGGRLYVQAHEIVMESKDWSIALIPQLSDALDTWGRTEYNTKLPNLEIKTDILDQQLPDGWLDNDIKGLIVNIVSGRQVSILDQKMKQAEFLKKLFHCMLCIPENLARQASFGASLFGFQESESRISQNVVAKGLRYNKGEWQDSISADELFGQKYLAALESLVSNCKTPREVMQAVRKLPQEITKETEQRFNG